MVNPEPLKFLTILHPTLTLNDPPGYARLTHGSPS